MPRDSRVPKLIFARIFNHLNDIRSLTSLYRCGDISGGKEGPPISSGGVLHSVDPLGKPFVSYKGLSKCH